MDLTLHKRYPVLSPPAQAWALLADLPATAACMPGAELGEPTDATHYRGRVRAKIGPAQLAFDGEIELQALDPDMRTLRLHAKGADKAGSAASMQLEACIEADPARADASVLVGSATVRVSGKLAQIGNRLLLPASEALLAQFATNFNTAAAQRAAPAAAAVTGGPSPQPAPVASAPLSLLGLLWASLRGWWAGRRR
jgi:hypothetical protein